MPKADATTSIAVQSSVRFPKLRSHSHRSPPHCYTGCLRAGGVVSYRPRIGLGQAHHESSRPWRVPRPLFEPLCGRHRDRTECRREGCNHSVARLIACPHRPGQWQVLLLQVGCCSVCESVTCRGTEVMCGSARHSTEIGDDTGLRSPLTGLQTASQIGATVVAATSTDGTVPLWSVRGNSVEPISKISVRALGRRATSAAWTADGNTVVVGCVDGTVSKWDLRNTQVHMLS
jgi:hypothetical protein